MTWFRDALRTTDGTGFAVADIYQARELGGKAVATYATAIRERGEINGKPIGVLGILFDWDTQAQAVVDGVRLSPEERASTRAIIVDSRHLVLASSDRIGVLKETFLLEVRDRKMGHYETSDGAVIGFALTPGYETYRRLGWFDPRHESAGHRRRRYARQAAALGQAHLAVLRFGDVDDAGEDGQRSQTAHRRLAVPGDLDGLSRSGAARPHCR